MKKLFIVLALCLSAYFGLTSCSGCSKSDKDEKQEAFMREHPELVFTEEDSTSVMKLCKSYLEAMKNRQYEEADNMLYSVSGTKVSPLSDSLKTVLHKQREVFPVLNYTFSNLEFKSEREVDVTYEVEFFEKSEDDNRPNTIRLVLAPKRICGSWYLTLENKSYIRR